MVNKMHKNDRSLLKVLVLTLGTFSGTWLNASVGQFIPNEEFFSKRPTEQSVLVLRGRVSPECVEQWWNGFDQLHKDSYYHCLPEAAQREHAGELSDRKIFSAPELVRMSKRELKSRYDKLPLEKKIAYLSRLPGRIRGICCQELVSSLEFKQYRMSLSKEEIRQLWSHLGKTCRMQLWNSLELDELHYWLNWLGEEEVKRLLRGAEAADVEQFWAKLPQGEKDFFFGFLSKPMQCRHLSDVSTRGQMGYLDVVKSSGFKRYMSNLSRSELVQLWARLNVSCRTELWGSLSGEKQDLVIKVAVPAFTFGDDIDVREQSGSPVTKDYRRTLNDTWLPEDDLYALPDYNRYGVQTIESKQT